MQILLDRIAEGDELSLERLYAMYSLPLFSVLLRILKVEAVAQEALQETFLKIWRNASSYDSRKSKPIVWMTRIAKNQAIDILRYQQIRADHELDDSNGVLDMIEERRAHFLPGNFAASEMLIACLDRLEEKPRLCVIRAYCEGYSHEELSSLTGSPIGTVKSWIRRSLIALKRCLDER